MGIVEFFGWAEAALLAVCALVFALDCFKKKEGLETLLPFYYAVRGTIFLASAFLVTTVVHDHVHFSVR